MSDPQRQPGPVRQLVVVGADGSRAAYQAVRWAAVEARLRMARLRIVHVEPQAVDAVASDRRWAPSSAILRSSLQVATDIEPEIDVETLSATSASVGEGLLRISEDAYLIALGIDLSRTRASHGARGPLEDQIAVHANCPVVTVAPHSFIAPGARSQVSVGWTDNHTAQLALGAAAEEAHLRGCALTVVTVPPSFDPQLAGIIDPPNQESTLIESIAGLEAQYPGLMINIEHRTGDVSQVLSGMAFTSELLVLGCHHSTRPWSIRTGPVAAAVMRTGHCPVMLVGRRARQPAIPSPSSASQRHS